MEKIINILLEYVEPDEPITAETSIKYDLGMSSFDLVCFGDDIFDEFGVRLTPSNFKDCDTVGRLAAFVENNAD
ncbi:MAG: acyl carrier protein [Clostridia bacterium]|nr:acyl carrier protein [Clostridia bacterium]MBQ7046509.1 acyl carrier protein [Oscillospiraceae bacterium]